MKRNIQQLFERLMSHFNLGREYSHGLVRPIMPVAIAVVLLAETCSRATDTNLNFDSLDASTGPIDATAYLQSYGITPSGLAAGIVPSGLSFDSPFPPGASSAVTSLVIKNTSSASAPNGFTQIGSDVSSTFTLNFSQPLSDFQFTVVGISYDGSHVLPRWSMTAYDGEINVGSVGTMFQGFYVSFPTTIYHLNATHITSVVFQGVSYDWHTGTGVNNSAPYFDDFVLTLAPVRPVLGITTVGGMPVVVWPACATNCVLQMTTNLASGNWVTVTNGIPFCGLQITNAPAGAAFFRLQ